MAIIKLKDDVAWDGAAWVFRYIVESLSSKLHNPRLESRFFMALNDGSWFLDLSDLDLCERESLRNIISELIAALRKAGPISFPKLEFFEGLLTRLVKLENMLSGTG
jgi:hypothetical protein